MSIFAIADTHLSLGTDKPMDSFPGWKDYVSRLKKNWNSIVKNDDTVVIAGDISWAMNFSELYPDFEFLNKLSGKKILVKGNHDFWWSTTAKVNNFIKENNFESISIIFNNSQEVENVSICASRGWMYSTAEAQDEKILKREAGRVRRSLESAKCNEKLLFLHYPPITSDTECAELIDIMKEFGVKHCYYGHLHGYSSEHAAEGEYDGINFRLISADRLKFVPLLVK